MSPYQQNYITANHLRMTVKEMADNLKVREIDIVTWKAELNIRTKKVTGPKRRVVESESADYFRCGSSWPF